jgi:hypothetical protein
LFIAGDYTALAPDALRHVKVKAILFARRRAAGGYARNGRRRFDFMQDFFSRVREFPAQHESDVIAASAFDEW